MSDTTAATASKPALKQRNSRRFSGQRAAGRRDRNPSRSRRGRRPIRPLRDTLLPLLLTIALLVGLCQSALADQATPDRPPPDLKAITAMDSKPSSLRVDDRNGAKGTVSTNLGDPAPPGTPSEGMGAPADKTVLQSDDLLISNTTDDDGNSTTQQATDLNDTMTAIDNTNGTTANQEASRSVIDHQYPSEPGRFMGGASQDVLAFRDTKAGSGGLWQVGTSNAAAESWTVATTPSAPVPGITYQISQDGVAIANTSGDGALGQRANSTAITPNAPDASQLWSVVDAGHGDGSFELVSKADGLCLATSGTDVTIDTCEDDPTRHWDQIDNNDGTTYVYPAGLGTGNTIGSDAGSGNAGTLSANTSQTWSFLTLNEPGGTVPTWSTPRVDGDTPGDNTARYDMATGDLDGAAGIDGLYHDEAVVAYGTGHDQFVLSVIDYNANTSHLLVTSPSEALPETGGFVGADYYSGPLVTAVGDFDGDGRNEIAVIYQRAIPGKAAFVFTLWRYVANADGSRSLNQITDCGVCGAEPFAQALGGNEISIVNGYTDAAVGDFDGDGRDDLALAFALGDWTLTSQLTPVLGLLTLGTDLSIRSISLNPASLGEGEFLPPALNGDIHRTGSGIQLESGMFRLDPDNGFSQSRRELVMGWVGYYDKGEKNYEDDTEFNVFDLTPHVQFYSASTDCAKSDGPNPCTTIAAALSTENAAPFSPFGTSADTNTAYSLTSRGQNNDIYTTFDAPPLTLEAGAFGGLGSDGNPATVPVWGVVASVYQMHWQQDAALPVGVDSFQVQTAFVVPWSSTDKNTINSTTVTENNANQALEVHRVTAYDRFGNSLLLGTPAIVNIQNNYQLELLAAEPAKHADYLNGAFVNASVKPDFNVSTQDTSGTSYTSKSTHQNSYSNGGSTEDSVKATFNAGIGALDAGASGSLTENFKAAWTGSDTTSANDANNNTTTVTATAVNDDVISYSISDYQVLRYPVLGNAAGSPTCDGTICTPYYEVTIAGSTERHLGQNAAGIDSYQPSWTNNNALSYPVTNTDGTVALTDLGSYTYPGGSGPVTSPLYNDSNTIGGNPGSVALTLNSSQGAGKENTTGHSWSSDTELNISASATFGIPDVDSTTIGFSTTDGFQASRELMKTTTSDLTTTTGQQFTLNQATIDANNAYKMGTAVYYSSAGTPKIVHGVNLTGVTGASFFSSNYTTNSDVALSLPNQVDMTNDSNDNPTVPLFNAGAARQLIRGFQALQVDNSNPTLPTKGSPFNANPTPGTKIQFQVPVHNYSLKAMPSATTAHFFAVLVDGYNNNVVGGDPIDLGSSPAPALGAQESENVTSQTWLAPTVTDAQQYRVFVVLDPDSTMTEIHPLTGGDPCKQSEIDQGSGVKPQLDDLTSETLTTVEPLACGQNNQGYGLITISPAPGDGAAQHGDVNTPANVTLAGGGLLDGNPAHQSLTEQSPVPTVPLNGQVVGLVHAQADLHSVDYQPVTVYDGDPKDDKVIWSGQLHGASAGSGGSVAFRWRPTTPGLHELHQVIRGTQTAGQDDEQIMRVWVDNQPVVQPFTVTAKASARAVQVGQGFMISGRVDPRQQERADRGVELQTRVGGSWRTIDSRVTTANGRYVFRVEEARRGTHSYRVLKTATSLRKAASSKIMTVKVTKK